MKDLAMDITDYMEAAEPYDFRSNYENKDEAAADILEQLHTAKEKILDFFADVLVDLECMIETEKDAQIRAELNDEYTKVYDIIERANREDCHD